MEGLDGIRDFPDHATFREKSVTIGLAGQAEEFPLCDKANFDPYLQLSILYPSLLLGPKF